MITFTGAGVILDCGGDDGALRVRKPDSALRGIRGKGAFAVFVLRDRYDSVDDDSVREVFIIIIAK